MSAPMVIVLSVFGAPILGLLIYGFALLWTRFTSKP